MSNARTFNYTVPCNFRSNAQQIAAIRWAARQDVTFAELARWSGLSPGTVSRIVRSAKLAEPIQARPRGQSGKALVIKRSTRRARALALA